MKYVITIHRPGQGRKKASQSNAITAILLEEYEHFYLFQGENYRFTVSKASLACGHYRIVEEAA